MTFTPFRCPTCYFKEHFPENEFERKKVNNEIRKLYVDLDSKIKGIYYKVSAGIFTSGIVAYSSPEHVFVYLELYQNSIVLTIYIGQKVIAGVATLKDQENWGTMYIDEKSELPTVLTAISQSFEIMKEAVKNNESIRKFKC